MEVIRKHKNDILLVLALLLLAGGVWAALRLTRRDGAGVSVAVDGAEVASLPLDRDGRFTWEAEDGSGVNTLVIENGAARMEYADCPDHLCVRQGEIRYAGESIVCLPHRLLATVTGGAAGIDDLDALAR